MADATGFLSVDPFFVLTGQINEVKTKVSDSVFENYKLQVAQTNDINNRAMQVALHDATALADLKTQVSDGTLQTMLAASRTDGAIGAASGANQRVTFEQGELTRNLVQSLNTQNLNTALINTNSALVGLSGQYGGLGIAYGGAVAAYQNASSVSAINAVGSSLAGNSNINTGFQAGTRQSATPTTIG